MDTTYLQNLTDEDLVAASGKKDEHAFQALYHRYEKRVFQYLMSVIGNAVLTEETMVEVMVAIWRGAEKFRAASKVSTWIFGIAHHKAVDAIRRVSSYQRNTVTLEDISETPDGAESPEEKANQKTIAGLTNQALGELSNDHREILHFAFYEELSYQEISTLLDIPINTVKTRVFYAKQQLKRVLERQGMNETLL